LNLKGCYDGPVTELQTARLLLRPWRGEDLDPYARMCADSDVMRYMPQTITREESSQQVSGFISHLQERGFGLWAVEEKASGAFIGRIGLMVHDDWPEGEHKTEVGWMLDRPYLGVRPGYRGSVGQCWLRVRGARLGADHQHNAT
jgi:RimJ/RimL family protein N-acetyltransferase